MKIRPLWIAPAIALIGGGAWWWSSSHQATDSQTPAIDLVDTVKLRDIESDLLLSGEVVPAFQVDVKPEVGGRVKTIGVIPGQAVHKGDLLAVIDDTDILNERAAALTEIDGAQLAVKKTEGNYLRAKALYDKKLISKEVFANLESDLAISRNTLTKSQRQLQTVKDKLDKTRILAPADGTILDVMVNEGQVVVGAASVNAGTLLMTFADLSRLLINSHVNQMDVGKINDGSAVDIDMQSKEDEAVHARIESVAPLATVKNNIKGFEVQALILDNNGRLKPGMSVSMHVPVGKASNAIAVPLAAVFTDDKQKVVYVRRGDHTEKRKVEVGLTDLSYVQITSGLEEGETILLVEPPESHSRS